MFLFLYNKTWKWQKNNTKTYLNYFQASKANKFYPPFCWLFIGKYNSTLFQHLRFSLNARLQMVEKQDTHGEEREYRIKSFYKLVESSNIYFDNDLASWKKKQGLLRLNEFTLSMNRTDFLKRTLNVSFVVTKPNTLVHLADGRWEMFPSCFVSDRNLMNNKILNWISR